MCPRNHYSYTQLIVALGIVRENGGVLLTKHTVWGFINSPNRCTHDSGLATLSCGGVGDGRSWGEMGGDCFPSRQGTNKPYMTRVDAESNLGFHCHSCTSPVFLAWSALLAGGMPAAAREELTRDFNQAMALLAANLTGGGPVSPPTQ